MKFSYKKYACIGVILAAIAGTLLMLEDAGQTFSHYYTVLYNRTYFLLLYLPLFLLGLLSITAVCSMNELLLRFESKLAFIWKLEKQMFGYAAFFTVFFLLVNVLTGFLLCPAWETGLLPFYVFLAEACFFQFAGWMLVGNLFLAVYLLCRNAARTYLATLIGLIVLTAAEENWGPGGILSCVNIHRSMYRFYETESSADLLWQMPCRYGMPIVVFLLAYLELKYQDRLLHGKELEQ